MSEVRVIQVNESVFAENDRSAELIRRRLTEQGTLFLNFMSSPGSGFEGDSPSRGRCS